MKKGIIILILVMLIGCVRTKTEYVYKNVYLPYIL